MMTTRDGMSDHERVHRRERRLEELTAETRRRIRDRFPLDRQLEILTAATALQFGLLSETADLSLHHDASGLADLIAFVRDHRTAAALLTRQIQDDATDLITLDVRDNRHWPDTDKKGFLPWTADTVI